MKPPTLSPYGLLLTFDGYGASASACSNVSLLYQLLETMPARIGMRALGHPHIVSVQEEGIRGLSGFTFIMESHISIHTYEERGFVTADIYSCKTFIAETAAEYIANAFGVRTFETTVIPRGTYFNQESLPHDESRPRERP